MSIQRNCVLFENAPGEWYLILERDDAPRKAYDWLDFADVVGPFGSERATLAHLDRYSNPGGFQVVRHGDATAAWFRRNALPKRERPPRANPMARSRSPTPLRANPTDASVARMRVVVLELPHVSRISMDTSELLGEWSMARDIRWEYSSGDPYPRTSYVSQPMPYLRDVVTLRRRLSTLRAHDVTREYTFARTLCPVDYDGFGTLTLAQRTIVPEQGPRRGTRVTERWVAIRREHWDWQTSRYSSGLCSAVRLGR